MEELWLATHSQHVTTHDTADSIAAPLNAQR
jgi:hypothetical protein